MKEIAVQAPAYVSNKTEDFWLDFFWQAHRDARVNRIELLKVMASVRIQREAGWHYWQIRAGARFSDNLRLDRYPCFGCRQHGTRCVGHHVIRVQYGGSNEPRNIVPLCSNCHARVHPWLTTERIIQGNYPLTV